MGFTKTYNRNGRLVFACEVSAEDCDVTGCTARHCPFGWCQRYYVCRNCWNRKEVRALFSKEAHAQRGCKKYKEMSARGENPFEKHIKFEDATTGETGTIGEIIRSKL